jgi:hypothetical protein
MNTNVTKPLFILASLVVFSIPCWALSASAYTPSNGLDSLVEISISYPGSLSEDFVVTNQKYWSAHEESFPVEFDAIHGSENIIRNGNLSVVPNILPTLNAVVDASIDTSSGSFGKNLLRLNGNNELNWLENGCITLGNSTLRPKVMISTTSRYDKETSF